MIAGHQGDGFASEQAFTARGEAAVQQHLGKFEIVFRRRYHAAAAGEKIRFYGEIAGHRRALTGLWVCQRFGNARRVALAHREAGIGHVQRQGDALGNELIQRHSRHRFDQAAEHVGGHAVVPHGAGLVLQGQRGELDHELCRGLVQIHRVGGTIRRLHHRIAELAIGDAGGVAQQVLHRDLALDRLEVKPAPAIRAHRFDADSQVLQFRQIGGHRIDQPQPSFFCQHHHRTGDDRLGHRGDAKNRLGRHRLVLFAVGITKRVAVGHFAAPRNQHHRAGNRAACYVGVEGRCDTGSAGRVEQGVVETRRHGGNGDRKWKAGLSRILAVGRGAPCSQLASKCCVIFKKSPPRC